MSTRGLDPTLETEIQKPAFMPLFMAEFLFDSAPLRFWAGLGDIVFDGNTYNGAGTLLSVSEIVETQEQEANGIAYQLSGIDSAIISLALTEEYQGRVTNLWFGAIDESRNLIGDAELVFSGYMDVMEIVESGATCTITLTCEHKLVILKKSKPFRYTPEDQKRRDSTDEGMNFVPSLQDKELIWGRKSPE